jgi:hypothetical protein
MFDGKTFVIKRFAIDRRASGAVAFQEISALQHKVFDDAVKRAVFVANWLIVFLIFSRT